jgi:hypothetical protein
VGSETSGIHRARLRLDVGAGGWLSDPACAQERAQAARRGDMLPPADLGCGPPRLRSGTMPVFRCRPQGA